MLSPPPCCCFPNSVVCRDQDNCAGTIDCSDRETRGELLEPTDNNPPGELHALKYPFKRLPSSGSSSSASIALSYRYSCIYLPSLKHSGYKRIKLSRRVSERRRGKNAATSESASILSEKRSEPISVAFVDRRGNASTEIPTCTCFCA